MMMLETFALLGDPHGVADVSAQDKTLSVLSDLGARSDNSPYPGLGIITSPGYHIEKAAGILQHWQRAEHAHNVEACV